MTGQSTPMVGLIRQMSGVSRLWRGRCFASLARSHLCGYRANLGSIFGRDAKIDSNKPGAADALAVPGNVHSVLLRFAWH
jgi:hypothetical protein